MSSDRDRIIASLSPAERELYEAAGGTLPRASDEMKFPMHYSLNDLDRATLAAERAGGGSPVQIPARFAREVVEALKDRQREQEAIERRAEELARERLNEQEHRKR